MTPAELLERIEPRMRAAAARYANAAFDADDLYQEGAVAVLSAFGKCEPDDPAAYYATVAANAMRRAATKRVDVPAGDMGRVPRRDDADTLEAFSADLTPRERTVLDLRAAGYKVSEIADHLNVNRRTVRRVLDSIGEKTDR